MAPFAVIAALAAPAPEQTVEFTVFAFEPVADVSYIPHADAAAEPVKFYPTVRSPGYSHAGPGPVMFVDAVTGEVVAEVSVPGRVRRALFIFSTATRSTAVQPRYEVQVVDESARQHPADTLVILNRSGLELAGVVDGRNFGLRAGLSEPFPLRGSVELILYSTFRGRRYESFRETIVITPGGRPLLILLPPYRSGSLEVQSRLLLD